MYATYKEIFNYLPVRVIDFIQLQKIITTFKSIIKIVIADYVAGQELKILIVAEDNVQEKEKITKSLTRALKMQTQININWINTEKIGLVLHLGRAIHVYKDKVVGTELIDYCNTFEETCCFTGHRPNKFSFKYNENHPDCIRLKNMLYNEIESLIKQGYKHFISGMALGVDTWAAQKVLELKKKYPNIIFEVAIPCFGQESSWPQISKNLYWYIVNMADIVTYVSIENYKAYLMIKRDQYMVDSSRSIIAIFDGSKGGTKETYDYAHKKQREIIQINPLDFSVKIENKGSYDTEHEQQTIF